MRIGLFIDTFNLGGAETMVFELASLLSREGHTPLVLHFGSEYIFNYCEQHDVESVVLPFFKLYKKTATLPIFALKCSRFIKSLSLDCVHSHLFGAILGMSLTCLLSKTKHIGTLHDVHTIEDDPKLRYLLYISAALSSHLIVVSSPMLSFYQQKVPFYSERFIHIPNFAPVFSPTTPDPSNKITELKNQLSIKNGDFIAISVGRLVPLKKFDILIKAATLFNRKIKLLIAGTGPEQKPLEDLIRQYNLSDNVYLLGEREDISDLLQISSVFILASSTEGLSRSILEAISAGLPVVATAVGGNSDLVKNGKNGFLIPVDDPVAIAQKTNFLAENETSRLKYSRHSAELATKKFGIDSFLEKHLTCYAT